MTLDAQRLIELVAISRAITESLDYNEVLRLIIEKTTAFTGAHACLLVTVDASGTATVVASRGVDEERAGRFRAPWTEAIGASLRELLDYGPLDAFVGVPLMGQGRIMGMLAVYRRAPDRPHPDDEILLAALADQAAIALAHATRHQAIERHLAESREFSRRVLDVIGQSVIVTDLAGRVTYWNRAASTLFGWSAEEAMGKNMAALSVPAEDANRARALLEHLRRGETWSGEVEVKHRDGTRIAVMATNSPLISSEGALIGIVGVCTDIRELKRVEKALRETDRQKSEFLAVLSHELRNPLTPVRNSLYLLERVDPRSDQATRARAVMSRQITQLTRLVDDLLDVTRLTGSKLRLELARINLVDIVRRTAEDHLQCFADRGIAFDVQVGAPEIWVNGDEARIAQVIGNLLSNAAKFTPHGGKVTLSVCRGGRGLALLRVCDSGAGLGAELLTTLFTPFVQADRTLDRSKGGLGLGLALVKGVVELHGGSVEAHSEGPGRGAEFIVRLPTDAPAALPLSTTASPLDRARPLRVLVIEDNPDAADTLREVLEFGAHRVEVAYDGPDGIERARRFLPEVVFCDIGLPGMDGYAVAKVFRSDPRLCSARLVALTGYSQPADQARTSAAGFDAHLVKPPTVEQIEAALACADTGKPTEGHAA